LCSLQTRLFEASNIKVQHPGTASPMTPTRAVC
jgi:hypothetical protein